MESWPPVRLPNDRIGGQFGIQTTVANALADITNTVGVPPLPRLDTLRLLVSVPAPGAGPLPNIISAEAGSSCDTFTKSNKQFDDTYRTKWYIPFHPILSALHQHPSRFWTLLPLPPAKPYCQKCSLETDQLWPRSVSAAVVTFIAFRVILIQDDRQFYDV